MILFVAFTEACVLVTFFIKPLMLASKLSCCCMRVESCAATARWEGDGELSWRAEMCGVMNRRIERKVISVPFIFISE